MTPSSQKPSARSWDRYPGASLYITVLSNSRTNRQRKIPSAEKDPLGVGLLAQDAEFGGDRSRKILDIGCGTGRHAIEPAKRGYEVTGIDLSESQIVKARNKVEATGVQVDFIVGDVREKHFDKALEVALMICEGAFPLMETDEMNFRILENAKCALEPGGKFMLTTRGTRLGKFSRADLLTPEDFEMLVISDL